MSEWIPIDFWVSVMDRLPAEGQRVLVYSPVYRADDPMRFRVMDAQFVRTYVDATHWAPLVPPSSC